MEFERLCLQQTNAEMTEMSFTFHAKTIEPIPNIMVKSVAPAPRK
jgi:hypothetical protein